MSSLRPQLLLIRLVEVWTRACLIGIMHHAGVAVVAGSAPVELLLLRVPNLVSICVIGLARVWCCPPRRLGSLHPIHSRTALVFLASTM